MLQTKATTSLLLKVTAFGVDPLQLGDSDSVKIGETVYVAGNAECPEGTFSNGIISNFSERFTQKRIQMTAPISPGSSGGPVLNAKGEVIGVSFHDCRRRAEFEFAASNYLKALLEQSELAKPLPRGSISAETYFIRGDVYQTLGNYSEAIVSLYRGNPTESRICRGVQQSGDS